MELKIRCLFSWFRLTDKLRAESLRFIPGFGWKLSQYPLDS